MRPIGKRALLSLLGLGTALASGLALSVSCKPRVDSSVQEGAPGGAADDPFPEIDVATLKKVDVLGIPFADTVLTEFRGDLNLGVNNLVLQDDFILRFAHLAEQHGRDLEAMGFESCYHYRKERTDMRDYRGYQSGAGLIKVTSLKRVAEDLIRARDCFLQRVAMPPDVAWKKDGARFEPPRVISLFFPNALTLYLDSTGTWPLGLRPNDQIGGRFNTLFLKMGGYCAGDIDIEAMRAQNPNWRPPTEKLAPEQRCHVDILNRPTKGAVANSYRGWVQEGDLKQGQQPPLAFPTNPPIHKITYEDGKVVDDGFPEDTFPFLLPPLKNFRGYYQDTAPRNGEWPRAQDVVGKQALEWSRAMVARVQVASHKEPYCQKTKDGWIEGPESHKTCEQEARDRYRPGSSGGGEDQERTQAFDVFYKICRNVVRAKCL